MPPSASISAAIRPAGPPPMIAASCALPSSRLPGFPDLIDLEPVELRCVEARHLVAVGLRDADEVVLDALARFRRGRVGVRVVGRPHEIVDPGELAREHADAV